MDRPANLPAHPGGPRACRTGGRHPWAHGFRPGPGREVEGNPDAAQGRAAGGRTGRPKSRRRFWHFPRCERMIALSGRRSGCRVPGMDRPLNNETVPAAGCREHHLQRGRRVAAVKTHTAFLLPRSDGQVHLRRTGGGPGPGGPAGGPRVPRTAGLEARAPGGQVGRHGRPGTPSAPERGAPGPGLGTGARGRRRGAHAAAPGVPGAAGRRDVGAHVPVCAAHQSQPARAGNLRGGGPHRRRPLRRVAAAGADGGRCPSVRVPGGCAAGDPRPCGAGAGGR